MSGSEITIVPWSPDEAPRLDAFDARDPLFAPSLAAQWDWAFRRNPAGVRLWLALRNGSTVARYAALPVRTRVLGETRTFAHVLASCVRPELAGSDVLLATARAFHAAHGVAEGDLVLYGWPDARDEQLAKEHFEHELLRVPGLLARAPGAGPSVLDGEVAELARFESDADVLYACCATHWNASAIRDAAFLNWRFAENPFRRYRLLGVRSGATLRGYAVYRCGDELHPRLGMLVDWLVLPGDDEAAERLLAAALACARADAAVALAASFPEWSPWSLHFQERGFLHHPTGHRQLVRASVARFDMLWLRDNWWSTLGDALFL